MFDPKIFLTVFGSVFLSELGDKTQLATFLFAATEKEAAWSVFLGSAAALVLSSALAVVAAGTISRYLNPSLIRAAAGFGFVIIGMWILINRS